MTSRFQHGRVRDVLPDGLAGDGERVRCAAGFAELAHDGPEGRRRRAEVLHEVTAAGHPAWPSSGTLLLQARSKSSSVRGTPSAAVDGQQVDDGVRRSLRGRRSTLMAFSKDARVRIRDGARSLLDQPNRSVASGVRQRVPLLVDRGRDLPTHEAACPESRPCRPSWTPCPWSCSARRSAVQAEVCLFQVALLPMRPVRRSFSNRQKACA